MAQAATTKRVTPVDFSVQSLPGLVLHALIPGPLGALGLAASGVGLAVAAVGNLIAQVAPGGDAGEIANAITNAGTLAAGTGAFGFATQMIVKLAPLVDKQLTEARQAHTERLRDKQAHELDLVRVQARNSTRAAMARLARLEQWAERVGETHESLPKPDDAPAEHDTSEWGTTS